MFSSLPSAGPDSLGIGVAYPDKVGTGDAV